MSLTTRHLVPGLAALIATAALSAADTNAVVRTVSADLQQASVRAMDKALGVTPAALLAGAAPDKDFELRALPAAQGLDWVQATPRTKDDAANLKSLRIGFKGKVLLIINPAPTKSTRARAISDTAIPFRKVCRPELELEFPPSLRDDCRSVFDDRHAGASPNTSPVNNDTTAVKQNTRALSASPCR